MKDIMTALGTVYAISTLPSVSGWSFIWRNVDNISRVKTSHSPQPCTQIDHAKGKEYNYNPESDGYGLWLWANDDCSGPIAGFTPPKIWDKNSSTDLRSYIVDREDRSSTLPSSTPSSTDSSGASSNSTGSGSSLSGGAIAGIVIGVVVGVAIFAALFFFLGRRKRKSKIMDSQQINMTNMPPTSPGVGIGTAEVPKSSQTGSYMYSPTTVTDTTNATTHSGSLFAELGGDEGPRELSDSNRINELEGRSKSPYN